MKKNRSGGTCDCLSYECEWKYEKDDKCDHITLINTTGIIHLVCKSETIRAHTKIHNYDPKYCPECGVKLDE